MWFFHRAPLRARRALQSLYHHLRFFKWRVVLRWQWWRSRQTGAEPFLPTLDAYSTSTFHYLEHYAPLNSQKDFVAVMGPTRFNVPLPQTLGYNPLAHLSVPFNAALFAAQVCNAQVYGERFDLIAAERVLLADVSYRFPASVWRDRWEHPMLERAKLPPVKLLAGRHALVGSMYADSNYFHWMFNALPRLAILERAGVALDSLDGFLLNRLHFPVQREMLDALRIPRARWIEMDREDALKVEALWVTPCMISSGHRHRWICDWLREHFLSSNMATKPTRRLLLSRADANHRRLANEQQVMELLAPLGFERIVIGQRSIFDQAALFAQAEIVLAPHTTALGNILFCAPGTRIIDFMPADRLRTYMCDLSACMGLDYYYAFSVWRDAPSRAADKESDTIIPMDTLRAMLQKANVL